MNHRSICKIFFFSLLMFQVACEKDPSTFSLLPEQEVFKQESAKITPKVDILWVIDNSGSMQSSQEKLADNFQSFIQSFQQKKYDFQMAVTTSDAYKAIFNGDPSLSEFRSSSPQGDSGVKIMTPSTPNLDSVFITNILQGISGHGDERVFQSMKVALEDPLNAGFIREDSFLAVIIVSDEDDFSHDTNDYLFRNYDAPELHPVSHYVDFLKTATNSSENSNRFSVSTISILDEECLDQVNDVWLGRIVGLRYNEFADLTNGVQASLCSEFGTNLELISSRILELSTRFPLSREPIIESLVIQINGETIDEDTKNGWTYNAEENAIYFHGTAIPESGSDISINFDPETIKL